MKQLAYLGAGAWGFSLSSLLADKGYKVTVWTRDHHLAETLQATRIHPKLEGSRAPDNLTFTSSLSTALHRADAIIESVTTSGLRPVFHEVFQQIRPTLPIILTSKGIEQGSGYLLPEIISEMIQVSESPLIGCLSGPSLANEVIRNLPTSVVAAAYHPDVTGLIQELFTTPTFRVYPNSDINGVCFGGAMKNIIAIACGIADGLGFGDNTKAALMTRGLHEIRKLCHVKKGKTETLYGLSGMGDLCLTCLSTHSRNYRYGRLIAEGFSPEGARQKIAMAIEGVYSCVSAHQLGARHQIPLPITEAVYAIIYKEMHPQKAVEALLHRSIKEEHL